MRARARTCAQALTYHLPLSEWYTDATSQWTLDYPPLFAYAECAAAALAARVDARMLVLRAEPYEGGGTVPFMRASVIAADAVLAAATVSVASRCGCCGPFRGSESTRADPHTRARTRAPTRTHAHPSRADSVAHACDTPARNPQGTAAARAAWPWPACC